MGSDRGGAAVIPSRRRLASLLIPGAIYASTVALVFRYFLTYKKSLVWVPDGLTQHIPSLYLFNTWLRGVLRHPGLGIPLWSWNIGLGADIISTLSFYVVGDPFALISLLFPMAYLEYTYAFLFLVRIACAGLASNLFFRKMGARPFGSLVGSLIYIFGTFLVLIATRQPSWVNALIFLPLLLIGIELALADRRPWVLSIVVFVAAVGNFYFFYSLTIIVVLYAVARYFELTEKAGRWKRLAPVGLRVAAYYLVGTLMAAPLLFPTLAAVLGASRGQSGSNLSLAYQINSYWTLANSLASSEVGLLASGSGLNATYLGFGYLGLLLLPVLFIRRNAYPALKFMIAAFAVLMSVPLFGSVFNGFTFPSNRVGFAWGIFIALSAALLLSEEAPFSRREISAMGAGLMGYGAVVLLLGHGLTARVLVPMALGAGTWALLAFESMGSSARLARPGAEATVESDSWRMPATRWAVLGLLVLNLAANSLFIQDVRYSTAMNNHTDSGEVLGQFRATSAAVRRLPTDRFFRVDTSDALPQNAGMVLNRPSTSFYFSLMPERLTQFKSDIANRAGVESFAYHGFDDRAAAQSLLDVEYTLLRTEHAEFAPYGFDVVARTDETILYRNRNALPLGFVYPHAMTRTDYERLEPVERQQAMLQAVVLEDGAAPGVTRVPPIQQSQEITYAVESTAGATFDRTGGVIERSANSRIRLEVAPVPDAEVYVQLSGINDIAASPAEELGSDTGLSRIEQAALKNRMGDFRQPQTLSISYSADGGERKPAKLLTPASNYYWGNHTNLVNLGYRPTGVSRIEIAPQRAGRLTFTSLRVFAVPMSGFAARVEELRRGALTDVELGTNSLSGTVSSATGGLLFMSIPYSTGWSATLDGKVVPIVPANTAFCGIEVAPGTHHVELHYATPGLKAGLAAAAAAFMALLALIGGSALLAARRRSTTVGGEV